jgi:TonB family protein
VLDLAEAGERVNVEMKLVLGALVFASNVPEQVPCVVGGHSWFNQIDFQTGAPIPGAIASTYLSDSLNVGFTLLYLPSPASRIDLYRPVPPGQGDQREQGRDAARAIPARQAHQLARNRPVDVTGGDVSAVAGPALRASQGGTVRAARLWGAVGLVVAMHAALLAIRPGGLTANYVAPATKTMAVRMLRPLAPVAEATGPSVEAMAQAVPTVAPAEIATASARPGEHKPRRSARREAPVSQAATLGNAATDVGPTDLAGKPAPDPAQLGVAAAPLPAAPEYALGIRLDPGPRPLEDIEPDYPDAVHLREGTVVLRLLISDPGHVDDVAVVRAQPRGVFEQAAIDAFAKARFAPGMAAGTPVKSQITVEVQFVPINRGARVSGRTY